MAHVSDGFLVLGPWPRPLRPDLQATVDEFRLEAATMGLSTVAITRDASFEFRVCLTPDTVPAPTVRPMGVPAA